MSNSRSSKLPYLVHTNREFGLMLRGIKPLAMFRDAAGQEPECLLRYWRLFDRHVATGRIIKQQFSAPISDRPDLALLTTFYALPGEEGRIDAMRALLDEPGEWSRDRERRQGELLGYSDHQNDIWLSQWQRPEKR